MKQSKVRRIHVVIIGVVVALILGAGQYFALISPTMAQIKSLEDEKAGHEQARAELPKAQQELAKAKADALSAKLQLARYEDRYMRLGPARELLSMADRTKAMVLLWKEQADTLAPLLERSVKKSGVRLLTPITVPAPPSDPNQIPKEQISIPLSIQVSGSFPQIVKFLRSIPNFPRLIQITNVTLQGESPRMVAQVDFTVNYLPRDSDKAKDVPSAVAGTDTGTYGGGYSGYPGPGGMSQYGPSPGAPPMNGAPANGAPANGAPANAGG